MNTNIRYIKSEEDYKTLNIGEYVLYPDTSFWQNQRIPFSSAVVLMHTSDAVENQKLSKKEMIAIRPYIVVLRTTDKKIRGVWQDNLYLRYGDRPLYVMPEEVLRDKINKADLGKMLLDLTDDIDSQVFLVPALVSQIDKIVMNFEK